MLREVLGEECQPDRLRGRSPSRGADDRDLKAIPISLPPLPSPDGRDASLEAGDWLIQLEPLIGDLSRNASMWWRQVKQATFQKYSQWLHAEPLVRLKIGAPEPCDLPQGYDRLDQRVTSLMMQAVPKCIKDEVVATRALSTAGILFKIYRVYQPGGLGERSKLLADLTSASKTSTASEVVTALRLWKRKASRATELSAQLPDPLLIRTLDDTAKPVIEGSAQAAFRIQSFRMQHALDVRPSLENVSLYYDLLLAEAELAMHSMTTATTSDSKPSPKQALKAMQASPEGKTGQRPCHFWLTESGCRQGQRCRWPHSWEGVTDKSNRCWVCSSLQHQQQDCPTKAQAKPPVGGEQQGQEAKRDGEGKKSKSRESKGGSGKDEGKKEETSTNATQDEVKDPKVATMSGAPAAQEAKPASNGTAELLQEATKLLKSLHLPSVKVINLKEVSSQERSDERILVDSGATHALRQAKSWEEWENGTPTVVALAQGTTSRLRLKKGTRTLIAEPGDASFGNGIVPMGALAKVGYEVLWNGGSCQLRGPDAKTLDMEVIDGCPMLSAERGMSLMEQLETEELMTTARMAMVRTILQRPELLPEVGSSDPMLLMAVMLKQEYPDLPDNIIHKILPKWKPLNAENLPWNRRRRRQIERSKRVILHLYSDKDEKTWKALEKGGTTVLCVDQLLGAKMNMLGDDLMLYLMKVAASGQLVALLGGPPCRTVSACRYAEDGGPGPVRSEEFPYGLEELSQRQRDSVEDDVTLLFRMKLLYMIAAQHKPKFCKKVLFGLEQPQDPKEYRPKEEVQRKKYMSIFRTQEWQRFQEAHELQMTNFEQGAFGHCRPKPTTFAHNINGMEQLDGAKAPEIERSADEWRQLPLQDRMRDSASWAQWAPGFKAALVEAITRIFEAEDGESSSEGSDQDVRPALKPLGEVALQRWRKHVLNDHQPMRRDCKVCVEAAGRSRPHRRVTHASAYTLSFDLSGRLKEGKDQWGTKRKYVMVGCYTFPTTMNDLPLIGPGHADLPEDIPLPSMDEMGLEEGVEVDQEDVELPRIEDDEAQGEEERSMEDEEAKKTAQTSNDSWRKLVEECQDTKVKTLVFTELLSSRKTP